MPPPAPTTTTDRPIPVTKTRPASINQPTPTSHQSDFTTASDAPPITTSTSSGHNATAILGDQSLEGAYSFIFGLIVFCSILFLLILAIGFVLHSLSKQKTGLPDIKDINAIEMRHMTDCTCKRDDPTNDNSSITSKTAINATNDDGSRPRIKIQDSEIQQGVRLYGRQKPREREYSKEEYYSMYLQGPPNLVPPPTATQKQRKNLCSVHSDEDDQYTTTRHGQNDRLEEDPSKYSQTRARLRSG